MTTTPIEEPTAIAILPPLLLLASSRFFFSPLPFTAAAIKGNINVLIVNYLQPLKEGSFSFLVLLGKVSTIYGREMKSADENCLDAAELLLELYSSAELQNYMRTIALFRQL